MVAVASKNTVKPKPTNLAKSVIGDFAGELSEKLGYRKASDLEQIVQKLGGEIRYESLGIEDSGGSLEVRPGKSPAFIIRLYSFAGTLRNRFTIAHELGHYFLHSEGGQKAITVNRAGSDRLEWEANWFAGAFLLPEKRFRDAWIHSGHSATRLAAAFQVSEAVVDIRLETLGLK